jgi:hypothetical protein
VPSLAVTGFAYPRAVHGSLTHRAGVSILFGFGYTRAMERTGERARDSDAPASETTRSVLIVATEEIAGDAAQTVVDEVHRATGGSVPEVHLVCPVLPSSGLRQTLGDVDEAIPPARERLKASLETLRSVGLNANGEIGDSDPVTAISDELHKYGAERILVITHARDDERAYSEKELLDRINREFDQPATELLVTGHGEQERVEGRETASPGAKRREEGRRISRNLPPLRKQDVLGIAVAILGTIALILLAGSCPDKQEEQGGPIVQFAGGCALRYLLAGGFFLINLGHLGALLLMESVGYRGPFERFFARVSLIGTPLAIIASALIS